MLHATEIATANPAVVEKVLARFIVLNCNVLNLLLTVNKLQFKYVFTLKFRILICAPNDC